MMDPFYRTIHGFQVLVEKDWLSFGYKFLDRAGHGKMADSNERAPVFQQWVDCVWQLLYQFPGAFEFNELMLIHLLDHLYSCRYGTFLYNSEKDRVEQRVNSKSRSVWADINQRVSDYRNELYRPSPTVAAAMHRRGGDSMASGSFSTLSLVRSESDNMQSSDLLPDATKLRLWTGYYLRWETLFLHARGHRVPEFVHDHSSTVAVIVHDRAGLFASRFSFFDHHLQHLKQLAVTELCRGIVMESVHRAIEQSSDRQLSERDVQIRQLRRSLAEAEARLAIEKAVFNAFAESAERDLEHAMGGSFVGVHALQRPSSGDHHHSSRSKTGRSGSNASSSSSGSEDSGVEPLVSQSRPSLPPLPPLVKSGQDGTAATGAGRTVISPSGSRPSIISGVLRENYIRGASPKIQPSAPRAPAGYPTPAPTVSAASSSKVDSDWAPPVMATAAAGVNLPSVTWVPDAEAPFCSGCTHAFSLFRRRVSP